MRRSSTRPPRLPQLRAAALAGGSSFTIATSKPKSTTVHHKLRYIAGGVLIVVIVVVLVVLLIGRRRTLEEEEGGGGEASDLRVSPRRLGLKPTARGESAFAQGTDTPRAEGAPPPRPPTGATPTPRPLHAPPASTRRVGAALALILGFMAVEVVAGVLAHSLALVSDAAHMLTDAAALGLSLLALRLAARPARGAMTYGFLRVEALAAQANGITLVVLAGAIVYSAVGRLISPPVVSAWAMVAVALAGIAVNAAATVALAGAGREAHMSVEGSFQHILTDLFAFIGTALAGVAILLTGFERADPIASLLVAALMVRSAVGLLRASGRIFLEAAPPDLDPQEIGRALAARPHVVEVHDLHVWELTAGFPALSAHVLVEREADCHATRWALQELLRERFGLEHTTLQVDHENGGGLLQLRLPEG